MLKTLLVAAVLTLMSASAQATVFKFKNMGKPYMVFVHNTLCDNKKGAVGVKPGFSNYLQMDWRGHCTDSCVDYLYVFTEDGSTCLGRVNIVDQCRTQTITLTGDGDYNFHVQGERKIYRVDWGMSLSKSYNRFQCPMYNDQPKGINQI